MNALVTAATVAAETAMVAAGEVVSMDLVREAEWMEVPRAVVAVVTRAVAMARAGMGLAVVVGPGSVKMETVALVAAAVAATVRARMATAAITSMTTATSAGPTRVCRHSLTRTATATATAAAA